MLQTRINLSRSAARMMMDASNQQSSAKTDLLQNAKTTLAQAAAHYANFKNMTPLPAMAEASANVDEKYQRYQAALAELIQFLDNGNMDAYFAQPTQGMQNALGEALGNCSSAKTPSTIISIVTTRIRLNIRHLPDNELSTLSAPAVITLLLQKGNTLFRKTTLPMTVSQRRCRRKMQGLGAGDEEALSPLAEA